MGNTYFLLVLKLRTRGNPILGQKLHLGKQTGIHKVVMTKTKQPVHTKIQSVLHRSNNRKSRKENPQKLTQLSSRSHPRHLVGKRTAHKDTIIDITSDSQVNSNFPYRCSLASLTFNNYFYLFLYLYIT